MATTVECNELTNDYRLAIEFRICNGRLEAVDGIVVVNLSGRRKTPKLKAPRKTSYLQT